MEQDTKVPVPNLMILWYLGIMVLKAIFGATFRLPTSRPKYATATNQIQTSKKVFARLSKQYFFLNVSDHG